MEIGIENKYVDTGALRINPISTATSESSFRVIVMSSLAYPNTLNVTLNTMQ